MVLISSLPKSNSTSAGFLLTGSSYCSARKENTVWVCVRYVLLSIIPKSSSIYSETAASSSITLAIRGFSAKNSRDLSSLVSSESSGLSICPASCSQSNSTYSIGTWSVKVIGWIFSTGLSGP